MNKRRDFVGIWELGTTTVSVFKFLSISLFFLQKVCKLCVKSLPFRLHSISSICPFRKSTKYQKKREKVKCPAWFAESLAIDGCVWAPLPGLQRSGQSPPPKNSTRFATFSTFKVPVKLFHLSTSHKTGITVSENNSIRSSGQMGSSWQPPVIAFQGTISVGNHFVSLQSIPLETK